MATSTIVITYTPATGANAGDTPEAGISFTVGGTAYNSLTAAQIQTALRLMNLAIKQAEKDKAGTLQLLGAEVPQTS